MRKGFKIKVGDVPQVVTYQGKILVATTELELANGIGEPFNLDDEQITVTDWLADQGHPLQVDRRKRTPPLEIGGTPRRVRRDHLNAIDHHCRAQYPREGCGMIVGRDVPGEPLETESWLFYNVSPNPNRAYQFPERDQIELYRQMDIKGWDPLVIWHSHTIGAEHTHPSDVDLDLATEPNAVYLILAYDPPEGFGLTQRPSMPAAKWWQIRDGVAREVMVELVD